MLKACCTFVFVCCLTALAQAQKSAPETKKPVQTRPEARAGFITPSEANVRIDADVRTFVVMAAVNAAGFDYENGGQALSPARAELRKDLAQLDPQVKEKLAAFYQTHRRADGDEAADAARYQALSLMMTQPPAFNIYVSPDRVVPEDLQPLLDFVP